MMYVPKTGSFEGMKTLNKSTILNMIRLHGPISRAQIAKQTTLTPPTVGTIVSELLEEKFIVEETGLGKVQGGRKPLMLSINTTDFYAVGVYAAAEVIHTVIATLDGDILVSHEEKIVTPPPMDEFLALIKANIELVLSESAVQKSAILGIGVGMHGLVDPINGVGLFSPHLHLENIPIKQYLEDAFDTTVMVENDVRALTLAESWYGAGKNVANFVCISVGLGIGSGIVINNEVFSGPIHAAGEIGHTIVDVNGPRCTCGNYGCLEAYASEFAILQHIKKQLRLGRRSIIHDWISEDESLLTMDMVFEAAEQGDPHAIEVLETSGRYLGIAIANLVNLLTPTHVILEGRLFKAGSRVTNPLKEMVDKCTIRSHPKDQLIELSNLGKKGMVIGAFTLILKQLYATGGRLELDTFASLP